MDGWSDERNEATFGKCGNANWHGHNFDLYVTVKGVPDPETGYFINFTDFKRILKEHVVEELDHRNLNLDIPFMQGKICSIENLVYEIWGQLAPHMPTGVLLHCIKLVETPRIYVEYFGD